MASTQAPVPTRKRRTGLIAATTVDRGRRAQAPEQNRAVNLRRPATATVQPIAPTGDPQAIPPSREEQVEDPPQRAMAAVQTAKRHDTDP